MNLTSPSRHRSALSPRQLGALAVVVLTLALIVGLVAMHALTQEGAVADAQVTAADVTAPPAIGQVDVLVGAACAACDHDAALDSTDLLMVVLACAMLILVVIWGTHGRPPLIGMRLPPAPAADGTPWRPDPRVAAPDLISLGVLRT